MRTKIDQPSMRRWAWMLGAGALSVGVLGACGSGGTDECFPVPAGDGLTVEIMQNQGTTLQGAPPPEEEEQGTSLQGAPPPEEDAQGTGLQGGPAPDEDAQGTSLQGALTGDPLGQGTGLQGGPPPEWDVQGTSLQGGPPPEWDLQGTSLQGGPAPGDDLQGTSLQGSPAFGEHEQGTGLQGSPAPGEQDQGTGLQGGPAPGDDMQGTGLQGAPLPDRENNGTGVQGGATHGTDRAYRSLGDLNGARLALAADAAIAVTLVDGRLVAPGFADTAALAGIALTATAPDGRTFDVQIGAVTRDGRTERIEVLADGVAVCDAGADGMFVPGRWDDRGAHVDDAAVLTYSCANGVIAKCVTWGYAPWVADAATHAACTRMARADYCGTGNPWTLDGTSIEMFDRLGIRTATAGGEMEFEAAWGPEGAVCAARTRYEVHADDDHLVVPICMIGLPACTSLDDAAAATAILANKSYVAPIDACE